jgi:hypothetical protein
MRPFETYWDIEIIKNVAVVIGRMDWYPKDTIMFMVDYIQDYYKQLGISCVLVIGSLQEDKK